MADQRVYFTRNIPPGQSLAQHLVEGKLSEQQAVRILQQLEDVLTEMHGMDLIHRRICPTTIRVSERRGTDFVKLLDEPLPPLIYYCRHSLRAAKNSDFGCGLPAALGDREPQASERFAQAVAWALSADPAARPATVFDLVQELAGETEPRGAALRVVVVPGGAAREELAAFPPAELETSPRQGGDSGIAEQRVELAAEQVAEHGTQAGPVTGVPMLQGAPAAPRVRGRAAPPAGTAEAKPRDFVSDGAVDEQQVPLRSKTPQGRRRALWLAAGIAVAAGVLALAWGRLARERPPHASVREIFVVTPPEVGLSRGDDARAASRGVGAGRVAAQDAAIVRRAPTSPARGVAPKHPVAVRNSRLSAPPLRGPRPASAKRVPTPATVAQQVEGERPAELLEAARRAYVEGRHRQALQLAEKLLAVQPAQVEALQIAAVSACHLGKAATARNVHARLKGRRRLLLEQICSRRGIELGASGPGTRP